MEMLPAAIAMQMAMTQQNLALSMVKKTADMQQQIASVLMESLSVSAPSRGGVVNIAA
jgi:hypothetical protein